MKKLILLFVLFMPSAAYAQTLDLTYGVGRTYDIPTETWGISNIPGVEFNWKELTVQLFAQFNSDITQRTETDIDVRYEKRLTEKISMSLNYGQYSYPARVGLDYRPPTDRLWYVETKIRLWERKPKAILIVPEGDLFTVPMETCDSADPATVLKCKMDARWKP